MEVLSKEQLKQRIVANSFPRFEALSAAFEALVFVQADPIRSPARAQDLILRQRVTDYSAGDLERCYPELSIEEGYLFAYGFMVPEVWETLRGVKQAKLSKKQQAVLDAIREKGETHPRDLADLFGKKSVTNAWGGKSQEAKRILEALHDMGRLRVCRRERGIRVYSLAEETGECMGDPATRFRKILLATAKVFGPVQRRILLSELSWHFESLPSVAKRKKALDALVADGDLEELQVEGVAYLWIRDRWPIREVEERVRILAPFDPLVRDRARFEQLWGWGYRFEAYVPAAKRERGYYAMPLLWRENVVGWVNASVIDFRLCLEVGYVVKKVEDANFDSALGEEAERFTLFLGLESGSWNIRHL